MSEFISKLVDEDIDSKYYRLHKSLKYRSDMLGTITVPKGFIYDHESVPLIKGTSNRAGCIHDYLCRFDSKPIVTKSEAATVYFEAMECIDGTREDQGYGRSFDRWWRRWVKSFAVRVAIGYFHRFSVKSTYEELKGHIA